METFPCYRTLADTEGGLDRRGLSVRDSDANTNQHYVGSSQGEQLLTGLSLSQITSH